MSEEIKKIIEENLEFKEMNPHLAEDLAEDLGFAVDRVIEKSNKKAKEKIIPK